MPDHKWHTRYFRTLDEVEFVFNTTLWGDQREAIFTYLFMGIRPDNRSCWTCNTAAMRRLTGKIDRYEDAIERGEAAWPWKAKEEDTPAT